MLPVVNPAETQAWRKLTLHYLDMQAFSLREAFVQDPQRFEKFHVLFEDILVDYSKNAITEETIGLFLELAAECGYRKYPVNRQRVFCAQNQSF